MNKRIFETVVEGSIYHLPVWTVVDGKGIELVEGDRLCVQFVRGSKLSGLDVEKIDGVLHETLLSMMIADMKFKNGLVHARESTTAITKLQEALFWLEERQRDRESRDVVGTYQK